MITIDNIAAQQDVNTLAFLRYLPKRIAALEQRIQRCLQDGWEAGGMAVLRDEVLRLASASVRYDLFEPSQQLQTLEQMLGEHIASGGLPEPKQCERMLAMLAEVALSLARHPGTQPCSAQSGIAQETPLPHEVPDAPDAASMPSPILAEIAPEVVSNVVKPVATAARRVCYLSDDNALAREIRQRLETNGYEIESVETIEELSELLVRMSPRVLLVGAAHLSDLTAIGVARRDTQQRSQHQERIQMVAMATQDSVQLRLVARRAGVDVLLFPPFSAADVLRQLRTLLTPAAEEKLRVLIVEDDHAQAMFAQSVLTNAGMQAQVEHDPLHVMESMRSLHPDLVLMDLHMPHINGLELTVLIREHPSFMHTPIVFLSGESDPEARVAAINAGGNDFLSKPIRPKHLIAAVQDRLRNARTVD